MSTFIKSLIERAGKTFVQVFITTWLLAAGLLNSDTETGEGLWDAVSDVDNLKAALVAAVLSVITSFVSKPVAGTDGASLVVDEVEPGTNVTVE